MKAHPLDVPPEAESAPLLTEGAAVGPQSFTLPELDGDAPALILMIFCDEPGAYELSLERGGEQLDRTWGESCPTSGIVTYQTAPISGSTAGLTVDVTTPADVSYRVAALAASDQ